jgi:ABC-type glycerol-3-phosphate transport system substrate-binding protein
MIKKIMLFIIAAAIMLNISSCGKKTESVGEKPALFEIEEIEQVNNLDISLVARSEITFEQLEEAQKEFLRLFDIELNINLDYGIDTSGFKSLQQVKSTGANGLYLFTYASIERINDLAGSGDILPVDQYLMDNPVWNELPSAMRKMYESSDGRIWALPRGFEPVVMGRVFRDDYLKALELEVPNDLNSLFEVSKALAESDPDGNGQNDTYGLAYSNAGGFRDVFYANGVPINTSNDGFQRTSISYNPVYGSFEDSMLMGNMKTTLEYIVAMQEAGILRRMGGRYQTGASNFESNNSLANSYIRVPSYVFTDDKYAVAAGLSGTETTNLNPLTYDFNDGFYLLGANTENPSMTINTFVDIFFGDIEGYLFASRGVQGGTYNYNSGTVEVLEKEFFSYDRNVLLRSNPLFTYETMDIVLNMELAGGGIVGELIDRQINRDLYIEKAKEDGIMYDITMDLAYPEVFKAKQGEIINSAAGTMFDTLFSQIVSGRVSIEDAMARYVRDMKKLGMQDIINDLNYRIDADTKFIY